MDDFFDAEPPASGYVKLSHMNNKSSVLCPESQDITSQYLALQQIDAHQRMIARAKGCVDTSPPRSLQSYISVADRKKKKLWQDSYKSSAFREKEQSDTNQSNSSRKPINPSEEDDSESCTALSVDKAIQTGIPLTTFGSKTADKISWYLEALQQGELMEQPFIFLNGSTRISEHYCYTDSAKRKQKRVVKGDIMQWHKEHFIQPKKPFSPRILADPVSKSKVKEMRCYNPPFRRRKRQASSRSSDTFESYDEETDDGKDEALNINAGNSSIEETQIKKSTNEHISYPNSPFNPLLYSYKEKYQNFMDDAQVLNRNEEDKYLSFLSKVTEDILRSGIYSDKAIQQAFEFHMQFFEENVDKDKLQSLLEQVLEGLKVSKDDSDDILHRTPLFSLSRPNTPPEKENHNIVMNCNEHLRTEKDILTQKIDDCNLNHSREQSEVSSRDDDALLDISKLKLTDS